jgi:hypothetical protein
MNTWQEDIHFCITHQKPSKLDGSKVFGHPYPLCQYEHGTWYAHTNPDVHVCATEEALSVTCGLCLSVLGVPDAN